MFIDNIDTIIKGVMNTEHFAKILKNHFQQLSLFLYIQFFRLIALTAWTQHLTHRCTMQLR